MKNTNPPARQTLINVSLITGISFLLWIASILLVWSLLPNWSHRGDYWAMTAALSKALYAATVFGVGYVAYRELSEIASRRHMEVADRIRRAGLAG